ncbi:LysR family transcriptional regulator [Sphingobium lactosutens]|nr:LysR family transcriptional regulator [Sphingobium lactosutens]
MLVLIDTLHTEGSVSAAAKRMKTSQPNASFMLGKLRELFGDQLFVRTGGAMRPTALGSALKDPVQRVIATIKGEILQLPTFDPLSAERTFTISSSDLGEIVLLPDLLDTLRTEAPRCGISMLSMPFEALKDAMVSGDVDLAAGYFPDFYSHDFFERKLFEHPFVCLASATHPTIQGSITLQQFLDAEHAVVIQEGRTQEIFEKSAAMAGLQRRISLITQHFMSLPALIARTSLITVVPRAVGRWYQDKEDIQLLEPPVPVPLIEIKQFWHRRVQHDPAVAWFRKLMERQFLNRDPTNDPSSTVFL